MIRHRPVSLLLLFLIVKMILLPNGKYTLFDHRAVIIVFYAIRGRLLYFSAPPPTSLVQHRNKTQQRKNVISCVSVGDSDDESQQSPKQHNYQSARVTPIIYPHTPNVQSQPVSTEPFETRVGHFELVEC